MYRKVYFERIVHIDAIVVRCAVLMTYKTIYITSIGVYWNMKVIRFEEKSNPIVPIYV